MTLPGIVTSAHALSYYQRLQEVTANNLANASTDGFKLQRLSAMSRANGTDPQPVEQLDLSQGQIHDTGRDLDVALRGPGFLVTQTPHGERLTRGGSLHLDVSGRIVDGQGDPVLGTRGPIVLPVGGAITIHADGTVLADGGPLDQLRIENVSDPSHITEEGANRFVASSPTSAVPPGTTSVQQGAVEQPNSDTVLGMVDLVTIQRAYAANIDAIKAMDGVLDTIAGQIGQTQP